MGPLLCSYKFSVIVWILQTKRIGNKEDHWLIIGFSAQEYIIDVGGKEGTPNQNTITTISAFRSGFK